MTELRDQLRTERTSDGIEILAVQPASGPHPHPSQNGKLVPFNHCEELLLANGQTRFRCVYPLEAGVCGKDTFKLVTSVSAHQSSHVDRGSQYPEETLRHLILVVRSYRAAGHVNFMERAAAELNRLGDRYATLSGEPWSGSQVSSLFRRYKDTYRTHVRQSRLAKIAREDGGAATTTTTTTTAEEPMTVPAAEPTSAQAQLAEAATTGGTDRTLAALDRRAAELTRGFAEFNSAHRRLTEGLADFIADVGAQLTALAARPDADPEVITKARKYDDLQKLLGRD